MRTNKGGRGNRNPYRTVAVRLPEPLAAWAKRCAALWNEDRLWGHTTGYDPVDKNYVPTRLKTSEYWRERDEVDKLCEELLEQAKGKENSPRWKKAVQLAKTIRGLRDHQ
jgi:hypothetical protein